MAKKSKAELAPETVEYNFTDKEIVTVKSLGNKFMPLDSLHEVSGSMAKILIEKGFVILA